MKIGKICDYLNNIGILQLESINNFLKIYSQLSQNKYKSKSDKFILALFSYITLLSKNDQLLYKTCSNIVNNYSNNMILHRYHYKYLIILLNLNFIQNSYHFCLNYVYICQAKKEKTELNIFMLLLKQMIQI